MRCLLPILLVALAAAAPASADDSDVETRAEELFRQAKELMAAGRHAEACPLLAESQGIDPGGGTLLTLALCYEQEGKLATAVTTFRAAIAVARQDDRADREAIAAEHIAALEPRLCRIGARFALASLDLPGFEVALDGSPMPPEHLAAGVAVDTGTHHLRVRATGKRGFEQDVVVAGEGIRVDVRVPQLEDEAPPAPAPQPAPVRHPRPRAVLPPDDGLAPTTVAGLVVGAAGLTSLGVGAVFAIRAAIDQADADELCPDTACPDEDAVALSQEAGTSADVATVALAIGGVCVATSLILLLAFPDEPDSAFDARHLALRW